MLIARSRLLLLSFLVASSIPSTCQMGGVTNQPYTATKKTTYFQKLADGTTINRVTTSIEARDSQGRTLQQHVMAGGEVQNANEHTISTVFDPVAHTMTHWISPSKQATRTHMPIPSPNQVHQVASAASGSGLGAMAAGSVSSFVIASVNGSPVSPSSRDPNLRPAIAHEKLGSRSIAGVYAEGTRTTITYPIGFYGNNQPMVAVSEIWTSPDLKITLLTTHDDPRSGTQTTEVINLDRAEPDPAIFQPPQGYEIKDQYPASN